MRKQTGNVSLIIMVSAVLLFLFFFILFDLTRIFVAREQTKNASDAAVLAAAQNLIYFDQDKSRAIARKVVNEHGCRLVYIQIGYDEVIACAEVEPNLTLIDRFFAQGLYIQSVSRSKVLYPWDHGFGYCSYYQFDYRRIDG